MYPRDKEDDLIIDLKFRSVGEFLDNFLIENKISKKDLTAGLDLYDIQYCLTRVLDDYNRELYDSMNYDELRDLSLIELNLSDFELTRELLIYNLTKDFEYRKGFIFKDDLKILAQNDDLKISSKALEVLASFEHNLKETIDKASNYSSNVELDESISKNNHKHK